MTTRKIDFQDTHAVSSFFLDYIQQKDSLQKFYHHFPLKENFIHQIKEKSAFPQAKRSVLVEELVKQYGGIKITESVKENIQALKDQKTTCFFLKYFLK